MCVYYYRAQCYRSVYTVGQLVFSLHCGPRGDPWNLLRLLQVSLPRDILCGFFSPRLAYSTPCPLKFN